MVGPVNSRANLKVTLGCLREDYFLSMLANLDSIFLSSYPEQLNWQLLSRAVASKLKSVTDWCRHVDLNNLTFDRNSDKCEAVHVPLTWCMQGKHGAVDPCFIKTAHTFQNFQKRRLLKKTKKLKV